LWCQDSTFKQTTTASIHILIHVHLVILLNTKCVFPLNICFIGITCCVPPDSQDSSVSKVTGCRLGSKPEAGARIFLFATMFILALEST
jgi:hypothetical protein